jgi:MFS transporter, ACS family, glucarate transporter
VTISSLIGGGLSDRLTRIYGLRVGRCLLASASLFFTALLLLLGSQAHSPQLAGIIPAGGAGAMYLSQSTFWSVSVDIAGRSSGVFSSLVNMAGQIGGAITATLTPWLASHFSWTMPFTVAATLAVIGSLSWLVVRPERTLDA